jgi:hypothetical protein
MATDPTVHETPAPRSLEKPDWSGLWVRTQCRCVTTLDLVGILFFDALILFVAGGIIYTVDKLVKVDNAFFKAAVMLSGGLFLLLYVMVVWRHVVEFLQDRRGR